MSLIPLAAVSVISAPKVFAAESIQSEMMPALILNVLVDAMKGVL
ncbi:hypothetical protein ACTWP4_20105 [Gracilibacillus sp. D59]